MPTTQSKYGKRFDEEFRREVAALASRPGARPDQVARDLGVSPWSVSRGKKQDGDSPQNGSAPRHVFASRAEAKSAIFRYIEAFYNRTRLHGALGYPSPVDFEDNLN